MARLSGVEPDTLVSLSGLRLLEPDGTERKARVIRARPHKSGGWILVLGGVRDRDGAESLRGAVLIAAREELPPPGEDEWFVADLVGSEVVSDAGEPLGTLEEVLKMPANDVFVVRGPRGEILLPVIDDVIRTVDPEAGRVTVHLLPGLVEESNGG